MKVLLPLLFLLMSLNSNAFTETKICKITSDVDGQVTEMYLQTNNANEAEAVRVDREVFTVADVLRGVTVVRMEGHDVVKLKAQAFDVSQGGTTVINYLYNGLTGTRRTMDLKLVNVDGVWMMKTPEGQRVNRLHVVAKRIFGQVVGISYIRPSFSRIRHYEDYDYSDDACFVYY